MKSLTRTGIRMLTAKYRSILIKCAIINASVFVGAFGAHGALAAVSDWEGLKNAVNDADVSEINVLENIGYDDTDLDNYRIYRILSIIGDDIYLDGGNQYRGLSVANEGTLAIQNITMQNFSKQFVSGAAIENNGTLSILNSDFISNSALYGNGGAIKNANNIINIKGIFEKNYTDGAGGAIENGGTIGSIIGDFISNASGYRGGALYNYGSKTVSGVTGNFYNNSSKSAGGAIWNAGTVIVRTSNDLNAVTFDGNYVKTGSGGAIWNAGTVGLYAVNENDKVEFKGGTESGKNDIDGIYNEGVLNINGDDGHSYDGTVNLYNVDGTGVTYVYGGNVFANGAFTQRELDILNAEMVVNDRLNVADGIFLMEASVLTFGKDAIAQMESISQLEMSGSTINLQNDSVGVLKIKNIGLSVADSYLMIDADLANGQMDQVKSMGFDLHANLNISDIKLLSDAKQDVVSLDLFADEATRNNLKERVVGNLSGLRYSPVYVYDAKYSRDDGKITFTRTEQVNPYIYNSSVVANAAATMTSQIATLAMDEVDMVVHGQGRSGGDVAGNSNAWVKVMGLDDNVEFKNFETVDSKALTVVGGFNTDKIVCGDCGIVFGAYAGYIGGKQQYTGNDIDQDGGYVGLSSAFTSGNMFATATINGGLLKNKATNMYGTDRFNTRWVGAGIKTGYNYAISDFAVLQPNLYAGYTLIDTRDYTSVSGVEIAAHNLNFFEIDPGFKLSAVIADGWIGAIQGKYAIVMNNGGDEVVSDIALTNISAKNYVEYGIGVDKSLTDSFYLGAKINRHDGGRTGWNGSLEFKYNF